MTRAPQWRDGQHVDWHAVAVLPPFPPPSPSLPQPRDHQFVPWPTATVSAVWYGGCRNEDPSGQELKNYQRFTPHSRPLSFQRKILAKKSTAGHVSQVSSTPAFYWLSFLLWAYILLKFKTGVDQNIALSVSPAIRISDFPVGSTAFSPILFKHTVTRVVK